MSTTYPQKEYLKKSFTENLLSYNVSKNTVKNYASDIGFFLDWLELYSKNNNFNITSLLDPIKVFGLKLADDYKEYLIQTIVSESTVNRHLASLRKFSLWLKESGLHNFDFAASLTNPASKDVPENPILEEFRKSVLKISASRNTAKNYTSDVRSFIDFVASTSNIHQFDLAIITPRLAATYISYIKTKHPAKTYKRKIASLKKFFVWANKTRIITTNPFESGILQQMLKPQKQQHPQDGQRYLETQTEKTFKQYPGKENLDISAQFLLEKQELLGKKEIPVERRDASVNFNSNQKFTLPAFIPAVIITLLLIGVLTSDFATYPISLSTNKDTRFSQALKASENVQYASKYYPTASPEEQIRGSYENFESSVIGQQKVTYSQIAAAVPLISVEGPSPSSIGDNIDSYYFLNISEADFDKISKTYDYQDVEKVPSNIISIDYGNFTQKNYIPTLPDLQKSERSENSTIQSIGSSIITAGSDEVTINSISVTDSSKIFITPISPTDDMILYVKEKSLGYFKVGFTRPTDEDVYFNWWVVE